MRSLEELVSILNHNKTSCYACGNTSWRLTSAGRICCNNCGEESQVLNVSPTPITVDQGEITIDRQSTHGDFELFSEVSQTLKGTVHGRDANLSDMQVEALEMICHKMARILTGDPGHKDHWADIAGYATRVSERL
jgi:hypothetical protein